MLSSVGAIAAAGVSGAPALTLPTTDLRGGWEARDAVLVSGDVDSVPDVSGNGYTMTSPSTRPTISTIGGHTAIRFAGGRRLYNANFSITPAVVGGTRTYYFVGQMDNVSTNYRAIFGGGPHWLGAWTTGNEYVPYSVASPNSFLGIPMYMGSLFQFSLETIAGGTMTLRDPTGTYPKAQGGSTFQANMPLTLGATNGAFYPMNGDWIAGYVYDGPYDADVPAYISQEWAGA